MNSNNQNEYNASFTTSVPNYSTSYPLTNDQTTVLNNMNYKDYLMMIEGSNHQFSGGPELYSSLGTMDKILSITGAVLGALGVPGAGMVVGAVQKILDILAPEDPWAQFMERVEQLVNQKIEKQTRDKAIAELEGLVNNFQLYLVALEEWKAAPSSTRVQRDVKNRFEILDSLFTQYIPSFRISSYEVPLLTVYTQAANLHLLLLRDASVLGEKWGWNTLTINNYYDRQMKLTAEYSNHCVKWYNTGLDRLRGSTAQQWFTFNQYRREMTLMVLDLVALFPNYDTRTYPMETHAELTRTVYTDPIAYDQVGDNNWRKYGPSFSELESLIRPPSLFTWLDSINIYTTKVSYFERYINSWTGHLLRLSYTNSTKCTASEHGNNRDYINQFFVNAQSKDIYQTIAYPYAFRVGPTLEKLNYIYGVPKLVFNMTPEAGPAHTSIYSQATGGSYLQSLTKDSESELPTAPLSDKPIAPFSDKSQPNEETYTHRLAYATMIQTPKINGKGYLPLLGWTHRSVKRSNTVYTDKITQIPVVKGSEIWNTSIIINSGYAGGGIIKDTKSSTHDTSLTRMVSLGIKTEDLKPSVFAKYRIRVKYAADVDGQFEVFINNTSPVKVNFKATMTSGANLQYNSFKYVEYTGYSNNREVSLQISSSTPQGRTRNVYIDKIEFIPENANNKSGEDLEEAKKAVNSLFTNTKESLQTGITDHQINQAGNLVECLSDELHPNEKRLLWDAAKEAKRLIQVRNSI
uniref:Crystaline entomocidal protoxin n=1 Tax=Bacillus thuringiensis TaxID=1428 RepID=A0A0M3KRL7_BACTU|nr:cry-like protein [Bacillus thuringiensis]